MYKNSWNGQDIDQPMKQCTLVAKSDIASLSKIVNGLFLVNVESTSSVYKVINMCRRHVTACFEFLHKYSTGCVRPAVGRCPVLNMLAKNWPTKLQPTGFHFGLNFRHPNFYDT